MILLEDVLKTSVKQNASDIFILSGLAVSFKKEGKLIAFNDFLVLPDLALELITQIYDLAKRDMDKLVRLGDDDFSFSVKGLSRFRVSTYKQRGSFAAVIRIVPFGIPDYKQLNIPEEVMAASNVNKGLVLVTGSAGSGKSTTLACLIDRINQNRTGHIVTLEEPIEFLHKNKRSIISQREIALDTKNYVTALRACLRQAPDVILVGEMRDYETIQTAMTAAETGHLVISSLHTVGAANTIDRIIDVFPPLQQQQIRIQLSMILKSVVSQQLVQTVDEKYFPAFEVMNTNNAIKNIIREGKTHQIDSIIATSTGEGMITMDSSLIELFKSGIIDKDTALRYSMNSDFLAKKLI